MSRQKELSGIRASGRKQAWKSGNMLYPVPVVMVSCARAGEKPNIITVAWAGTVCSDPAMISISVRPGRYSHDIIRESGEFVVNLVTEDLAKACDWCGVKSGREVDKFAYTWTLTDRQGADHEKGLRDASAGEKKVSRFRASAADQEKRTRIMHLTAGKADKLTFAPVILESPVSIECRVRQVISLGSHDMFLGEVEAVDADEAFLDRQGRLDLGRASLITYSHGEYYGLGRKIGSFGFSVRKEKRSVP